MRSADVYSADYANTPNTTFGPLLPGGSRYQEKDWSATAALAGNQSQGEVARVLSSAYPERSVGELTADLKAAGRLASSAGNIKNWEAIAATQAAIWRFTDGKELDTTRYADPVSVLASSAAGGFGAENVLSGDPASGWRASEAGPAHLDFVFPAQFQPRSYTVTTLDGGSAGSTPASWKLQRSSDGGATYVDVSASSATGSFSGGAAQSRSTNIPDGATDGSYTDRYRLVFTGAVDPGAPVEVGGVSFEGFGVFGAQPNYVYRAYANPANVVAAYEYLVDLALRSPRSVVAPVTELTGPAAPVERGETSELIGPFRLGGNVSAEVSVGGVGGAELLLDPSATPAASLVLPAGSEFWVRTGDVESGTLRISAASTAVSWVTARALEGAGVPALTQLGVQTLRSTQSVDLSFAAAPPATAPVILPAATLSSPKAPGTAVVGALTTTGAEQRGGPLVALLSGAVALLGGTALLLRSAALRRAAHRRRA